MRLSATIASLLPFVALTAWAGKQDRHASEQEPAAEDSGPLIGAPTRACPTCLQISGGLETGMWIIDLHSGDATGAVVATIYATGSDVIGSDQLNQDMEYWYYSTTTSNDSLATEAWPPTSVSWPDTITFVLRKTCSPWYSATDTAACYSGTGSPPAPPTSGWTLASASPRVDASKLETSQQQPAGLKAAQTVVSKCGNSTNGNGAACSAYVYVFPNDTKMNMSIVFVGSTISSLVARNNSQANLFSGTPKEGGARTFSRWNKCTSNCPGSDWSTNIWIQPLLP